MSRPKGSKNKSTIQKEILAANPQAKVENLDYKDLVKVKSQVCVEVPKVELPPVDPVLSVINTELAQSIIDETRRAFDELIETYSPGGLDKRGNKVEVPERVQDTLRKVYRASNKEAADVIRARARELMFYHLLQLWAQKKIYGPNTVRNIETRAKSAESWADRLEKEGKYEAAEVQRQKAIAIRATLKGD
jgi:hypothetical protein